MVYAGNYGTEVWLPGGYDFEIVHTFSHSIPVHLFVIAVIIFTRL